MSNEFKHGTVGTELTQAEWEGIGTHVLDSQAAGDIVYASSSSQLRRLAKGTDTHVLILSSGFPAWSATTGITTVGTIATGVWQGTDVGVAYGGTGASTLTANGVLIGNGSSAIASVNMTTKGHVLIGDGSGNPQMLPVGTNTHVLTADTGQTTGVKWDAPAAAAAGSLTGSTLASGVTASSLTSLGTIATGVWQGTDVGVAYGGTGVSTLTDGGVLLGSGTAAITAMAVLTDGQMIVGNGSTDPVAESGATLRTSIGVGTGDSPSFTGLTLSGVLSVDDSTDSTSTTTGSIHTDGGIGIVGALFVGGAIEGVGGIANARWNGAFFRTESTTQAEVRVDTTSRSAQSMMQIVGPQDITSGELNLRFLEGAGDGSAGDMAYSLGYEGTAAYLRLESQDIDGSATTADIWRVYDGNTDIRAKDDWVDDYFDYICDGCNKHSDEMFACCGEVKWHDDVLALREMGKDKTVMKRMVDLGIMHRDERDGWVGISLQAAQHFTWSGIYQNRTRMDAQYETLNDRMELLERKLEAV